MREEPGRSRSSVVVPTAAVVLAVVLLGACSMGSSAPKAAPRGHGGTSTSTTAAPTTTTAPHTVRYTVRRGDSLSSIAAHFGVAVSVIVKRNHIVNPDRVAAGLVLLIPPRPPLLLAVTPARGGPGQAFRIELSGARAAETVVFEIDSPAGSYRGGPHIASTNGTVVATYQSAFGDAAGVYRVVAHGNRGTRVQTTFRIVRGSAL